MRVNYIYNIDCLEGMKAIEWVEYNPIRALPYAGPTGPIIMHAI